MSTAQTIADPQAVLDFWFGEPDSDGYGAPRKVWFDKDTAFDRQIENSFGRAVEQALSGALDGWAAEPRNALARIILLDQFTRNIFRGDKRSFAGDPQALAAAGAAVGAGFDAAVQPFMRAFFYLPFEHSEALATQNESVRLLARLAAEAPAFEDMLAFAKRHRDVIERFGRFPHRNAMLGRPSTREELAYLAEPGSGF